ncbi:MAG: hypothetical protein HQK81_14025 [Desulfovibrionaceae bacterium]|nr:hypothetical protein [Desulfovibrionaceae bacterium]MBF0515161.1 hypothetical protein [Desulfovibrionaceae bacterium]
MVWFPRRLALAAFAALAVTAVAPAWLFAADLVNFKQLMAFVDIPAPDGFTVAEKPSGSTTKSPVMLSEAKIVFAGDEDKSIEISVMDGLSASVPFMAITQAVEMESSEEYIKPLNIKGIKGNEAFRFQEKEGELTLVVDNRFLVSVRGTGLPDNDLIKKLAAALDFARLVELGK